MAYRLLVLSSDNSWLKMLVSAADDQYQLTSMAAPTEALERVLANGCDLAVVDLELGSLDGLNWLKVLRRTDAGKEAPVIVVSRRKSDDEVADAFEWGADDYVLKSCEPAEVLARIRSALRRRFERHQIWGPAMSIGSITLDPTRHQCVVRDAPVTLHPREFELLEILMRKAGRVLSRPYLLEAIWGMSRFANTRTVDVAVSRLRRALGKRAGRWIETVERFGYRYKNPQDIGR